MPFFLEKKNFLIISILLFMILLLTISIIVSVKLLRKKNSKTTIRGPIIERDFFLKNKIVFQFWTEDNPFTPNRIFNLNEFPKITGMKNLLITTKNIHEFIVPQHPLHKAYKYLSPIHKSDYLRPYFGYFHGGGYGDIKKYFGNWEQSWKQLIESDDSILMNSHPNPDRGCIPVHLSDEIKNSFSSLPSVCIFLSKQYNPIMYDWLIGIEKILDEKYEELIKNPPREIFDHKDREHPDGIKSTYPIGWNELGASILHTAYFNRMKQNYPNPIGLLTMPFLYRNCESYR
jgi:hypothetical protein